MTAQRILKIIALIALAAGIAAFHQWRSTGLPPDPWLLRLATGGVAAAVLVGLISQETRPRVMLRFLSGVAALVAVIALVSDLSRAEPGFTSLSGHLSQLAPSVLGAVRNGISQTLGEAAWNKWGAALFATPTFIMFFVISAICAYASRKRHKISVYVN